MSRGFSLRDVAFVGLEGSGGGSGYDFSDVFAWFKCDEEDSSDDLVEAIGSKDLTLNNTAAVHAGAVNGARSVTSTTEFVTTSEYPLGNGGIGQNYSFAAWVYMPSSGGAVGGGKIATGDTVTTGGWYLTIYYDGADAIAIFVANDGTQRTATVTFSADTWTSICWGFDLDSNEIWIQAGTSETDSDTWSASAATSPTGTNKAYIEADSSTGFRFDNIGVWKRVLSTGERNALATAQAYIVNEGTDWTEDMGGYYPCDERTQYQDLFDIHSGNDIGHTTGSPPVVSGALKGGRTCNGSNIPQTSTPGIFNFANSNKSVILWVNYSSGNTIVGAQNLSILHSAFRLYSSGSSWRVDFYDTGGALSGFVTRAKSSGWQMIAFGHDADNDEVWLSVNGAAKTTASHDSGGVKTGINDVTLSNASNSGVFNVDNVVGYNKVLTDEELSAHYNGGTPIEYIAENHWDFNENTGNDADECEEDVMGNNLDPQFVDMPQLGPGNGRELEDGDSVTSDKSLELYRMSTFKNFKLDLDVALDASLADGEIATFMRWGDVAGVQDYRVELQLIRDGSDYDIRLRLPGGDFLVHGTAIDETGATTHTILVTWDISTGTWSLNVDGGTAVTNVRGTTEAFEGQGGTSKLKIIADEKTASGTIDVHFYDLLVTNIL